MVKQCKGLVASSLFAKTHIFFLVDIYKNMSIKQKLATLIPLITLRIVERQ